MIPAALWHAILKYATRDLPSKDWEVPPGISTLTVCDPSGLLPTEVCPSVVSDVFLSGHEPTQPDTLYRAYQTNRETGRLATVFTPPELIEERVYMIVPPEASDWARQAGVETPPDSFDLIDTPNPSPQVQITSPEMFANLKGKVTIRGSATGDDFLSYRLLVGKGLNPQNWLAITDENNSPVENGILGTWDTANLDGLYAIQLIVIRAGEQVETTTIQVSVDNQAPQVTITYPPEGETISAQENSFITIQVQASDNLGLERVEYKINGTVIETQRQPPFALPWRAQGGDQRLSVKVVDVAGNENSTSLIFSVHLQE